MRREKQIFSCQEIDWEKVESLFEEMGGEKLKGKLEEGLPLPNLAIISEHVRACKNCGEILIELARKHGISKGIIFQREQEIT